ncbi:MAG: hypothetical protein GC193_14965 [Cryomorphaceae bacterium]|nr:hypothetical protein [Cryomorphaceae bacterium]
MESNYLEAPGDIPAKQSYSEAMLKPFLESKNHKEGDGAGRRTEPPSLLMTDAFLEARSERPAESQDSNQESTSWTIAIDLTASGSVLADGERRPTGARNKIEQILELADSTRGTPLTILVQAPLPLPQTIRPDGSVISNRNDQRMATYRIANGEVELIQENPSLGFSGNLEQLLNRATEEAGDGRLGLFIQSHGFAGDGIGGDTGDMDLQELESTIQNSMAAGGRDSLDLLDLDSCSMGNLAVLDRLEGETKNLVASPETESSFADADGQNLSAALKNLIENPQMSPEQFAKSLVEQARNGENDDSGNLDPEASGTDTLTHYNMEKYSNFENDLGELGESLSRKIQEDPANREVLNSIINGITPFDEEGAIVFGDGEDQRRDIGLFLDGLENALNAGKLADTDGELSRSVTDLKQSLDELIVDYHGEPYRGYDQMAGLSVNLPDSGDSSLGLPRQWLEFLQAL